MGPVRSITKTLPGDPPIDVVLRASARARRITLRISALDGRVTLTRPARTPEREAMAFAVEKSGWLRAQIARQAVPHFPAIGGAIPVEGRPCPVIAGPPGLTPGGLRVRPDRPAGPQVAAILKAAARDRLTRSVARHAAALGRPAGRITLRDTRSRWGSCNHRGDLMFSWRLVMAPPAVLDYVVAHEVAHLRHMDHSAAFWAVCEGLCPGWRGQRDWLRAHGAGLHAWRFAGED